METNFYKKSRRLKHCYKIVGKNSQVLPFVKNKAQEVVAQKIKELREQNQGKQRVQLLILKGRQLGITTYACINNLDEVMVKKNLNTAIVAHKLSKQREIFKKVEYAFTQFPQQIKLKNGQIFQKPDARFQTASEIFLKTNSGIQVTLDSRSGTFQKVHITELAFRPDAEEMITGTLPSVPEQWGEIIIETTANGVGNYFHQLWQKSYNNPESKRKTLFLGRRLGGDYHIEGEKKSEVWLQLPFELQHLEKPMVDGTILTEEQKRRYLAQYQSLGKQCFQEYPSTPEEAFLTSGDPFFDLDQVKQYARLPFSIDAEFKDLKIYKPAKYKYCMYGVDTAAWGEDGDFSSIRVRDQDLNLLASYYGKIEPDELCKVIDRLMRLGYVGVLGIENNNTWIATIAESKKYVWHSLLFKEKTVDKTTNRTTHKLGRNTNSKTRPLLLADYKSLYAQDLIPNIDEPLRHEMFSFVYNAKNRPEASLGNHDDAVLSDAICCYMRNHAIIVSQNQEDEECP